MNGLCQLVWGWTFVACAAAVGGDDVSARDEESETAGTPESPVLERIQADWTTRTAKIRCGQFTWQIERDGFSPSFDGPVADPDLSGAERSPRTVRILFDETRYRLDGSCAPPIRLLDPVFGASLPSASGERDKSFFDFARSERFAHGDHVEKPQPYTVVIDPERESHFWAKAESGYPRGLVLPAARGIRPLRHALSAAGPLPLQFGMLEGLRLAVRPSFGSGGLTEAARRRVLSDRQLANGRRCIVVEERQDDEGKKGARRLWIDPDMGHVIVRCNLYGPGNVEEQQYDIDYERNEAGLSLPVRLALLRLDKAGDVIDLISAVCRAPKLEIELPPETFSLKFPRETWVIDHVAREQYYLRANGTRRVLTGAESLSGITYSQLHAEESIWIGLTGAPRQLGGWLARAVPTAVTWPGILITLPAAYVVIRAGRAGRRYMAGRRAGLQPVIRRDPL